MKAACAGNIRSVDIQYVVARKITFHLTQMNADHVS